MDHINDLYFISVTLGPHLAWLHVRMNIAIRSATRHEELKTEPRCVHVGFSFIPMPLQPSILGMH